MNYIRPDSPAADYLLLPLLVFFGVTDSYPEANERHYHFMMEGLKDVKLRLEERDIGFICLKESPEKGVQYLLKDAKHLVMDVGYMKIQRFWRKTVLEKAKDQAIESWTVESDQERKAVLRLAFDDWMTVWINGAKLKTTYHEKDFSLAEIPVTLKKGKNEILVKSVNFDKLPNNRLWAFSLVVE